MNSKDITIDNKLYVGDEIKNSNTPMAGELPVKIINLPEFTGQVIEILETISLPEYNKLEVEDNNLFRNKLIQKFENFYDKYYAVFRMLLDRDRRDDNVARLFSLIQTLQKVQEGKKDLQKEEKKFYEGLNHEFIYSQHGGKTKFEQKIMDDYRKNK